VVAGLGLIGAVWLLAVAGFACFHPLAIALLVLGLGLLIAGSVWLRTQLAGEDEITRLLIAVIPFRWLSHDPARLLRPVLMIDAGVLYLFTGIGCLIAWGILEKVDFETFPEPAGSGAISSRVDQFAHGQLVQRGPDSRKEARSWLKDNARASVGIWDHRGSVAAVEDLYARGAQRVYALIDAPDRAEILVVVLPKDRAARKRLFAWEADLARRKGEGPSADENQNYLYLVPDK
jgi:hypothetical protein